MKAAMVRIVRARGILCHVQAFYGKDRHRMAAEFRRAAEAQHAAESGSTRVPTSPHSQTKQIRPVAPAGPVREKVIPAARLRTVEDWNAFWRSRKQKRLATEARLPAQKASSASSQELRHQAHRAEQLEYWRQIRPFAKHFPDKKRTAPPRVPSAETLPKKPLPGLPKSGQCVVMCPVAKLQAAVPVPVSEQIPDERARMRPVPKPKAKPGPNAAVRVTVSARHEPALPDPRPVPKATSKAAVPVPDVSEQLPDEPALPVKRVPRGSVAVELGLVTRPKSATNRVIADVPKPEVEEPGLPVMAE